MQINLLDSYLPSQHKGAAELAFTNGLTLTLLTFAAEMFGQIGANYACTFVCPATACTAHYTCAPTPTISSRKDMETDALTPC